MIFYISEEKEHSSESSKQRSWQLISILSLS